MAGRTFNVELHCHTCHSMDGVMSFDAFHRTARAAGLHGVAITDHDRISGAVEFERRIRDVGEPLQIIIGEEKTLDDGSHLIGLFLERAIASGDLAGALGEIEGQGGLCLIPHPFRRKDGLFRDGLERLKCFEGRRAGFELFNAKCSFTENQRAAELLTRSHLVPFGGSDAHYECDLGEAMNVIEWRGELRKSVQQMFEGRAPFRILGKTQREGDRERAYAPLYYRVKKYVRLPKLLVPAGKECYRRYRNWKYGVGPKPLREVYRHA